MNQEWIIPTSHSNILLQDSVARRVKYVCLHGPRGTGKTEAALDHLCYHCMDNNYLDGLITRNEYNGMSTTIIPSMKKLFGVDDLKDNKWLPFDLLGTEEAPRGFKFKETGSVLWLRGLDEKTKKVRGVQPSLFYLNEAIRQRTIDAVSDTLGGMAGSRGKGMRVGDGDLFFQALFDTNPDSKLHWVWNFFNEIQKKNSYFLRYHFPDNAWYTEGELTKRILNGEELLLNKRGNESIDDLLVAYPPGFERDRNVYGLWVGAEGAVFPHFDDNNLIDELPNMGGPEWSHYRWIDFGDDAPFVCLFAGHNNKTDELIIYKEYRYTRRLITDHAKIINEISEKTNYRRTIGDAAHPGLIRVLEDNGIPTYSSEKDIKKCIQLIGNRIYNNTLKIYKNLLYQPEDSRILNVSTIDRNIIEEIGKLIYKEIKTGAATDDLPDKRCSNHGTDALGYGLLDIDGGTFEMPDPKAFQIPRSEFFFGK